MTQLKLTAQGRLVDRYSEEDLTEKAHQHLFDELDWQDNELSPRSIFLLMQNAPQLHETFKRWLPQEMLQEALGPEPSYSLEGGIEPANIEHLELFRTFYLDSDNNALTGLHSLMLHGVGHVQQEDVVEHGIVLYRAGSRPHYGLDLTSCRKLLDLPIRFCQEVNVHDEVRFEKVTTYQAAELRLGEFLQAVLEELAYYGPPEETTSH